MNCTVKGKPVGPGMDVKISGADTLPQALRTWNINNKSKAGDFTKFMPWRAPGSAASSDPCGVSNGHRDKVPGRGGGMPSGAAGSALPMLPNNKTIWKAGATAEVAWSLFVK
jgi:hypothetical protein